MNTCIYMTESLHCSPETLTTLLIGYTQIQNKNLKIKKKNSTFKATRRVRKRGECPVVAEPDYQLTSLTTWMDCGQPVM